MDHPQLVMWRHHLDRLSCAALPDGYSLRTFMEGDEQAWVDLLNRNGQLREWNAERAAQQIAHGVIRERIHFITREDKPVATACICCTHDTGQGKSAEVGWVAVDPAHQGKGLGFQVTLAALLAIRDLGFTKAYLRTDDWRLAAVKTYLKLGFEPDLSHESYPRRWLKLRRVLGGERTRTELPTTG